MYRKWTTGAVLRQVAVALVAGVALAGTPPLGAQQPDPAAATAGAANPYVGLWRTIDDQSRKPRALVRIVERNGELSATIEKLFQNPDPNPLCTACEGELKGKPIVGLRFVWGLRNKGSEWTDGRILDPESGSVYKAKMKLVEDGRAIEVRGFIGISLLGRTQTWVRDGQ